LKLQQELKAEIAKVNEQITAQKRIIKKAKTNQVVLSAATVYLRELETRLKTLENNLAGKVPGASKS